jgi:hypothetical protein
MYARSKSHDDATLSYLKDALYHFHSFKDEFLLGQAGKKAKPKAKFHEKGLVRIRKVDEETTSAKCNFVLKRYAYLPDTPVALTTASKYFQLLPAPPGGLQNALTLCKSILTCS